ncbi:MAG: DUF512 domain-containing protein, partial [Lachnospiraceae bacterium]
AQLKGKCAADCLLLPINMLRSGEETLLDDYTLTQVSGELHIPIRVVSSEGEDLLKAITKE